MELLAAYLIVLIHMMDTSIVNIALVPITTDLGVDAYDGQWVITSFLIGMATSLPFVPKFVEWLGDSTALTVVLLMSLVSLILCGLADSLLTLSLSRFVQGTASGAVTLVLQRLLLKHAGPEHRAFGLALWSSALFIAPAIAPFVGAAVISFIDWRWVFFWQVPVLLSAAAFLLEEFSLKRPALQTRPSALQAILFAAVIFCVEVGLDSALNPETRNITRALLCFAGGLIATALLIRASRGQPSLFEWSLLRNRVYLTYTSQTSLQGAITLSTSLIYTLWLQLQLDLSVLDVAWILAGTSVIAGLSSPFIGRMKQKYLYPHLISAGLICLMASFWLCTKLTPDGASLFDLVLPRLLLGLGVTLASPAGYLAVADLSSERVLAANSLGLFLRVLGGTLLVLLSSEIAQWAQMLFSERAIADGFGTQAPHVSTSAQLLHSLLSGSTSTEAMHVVFWIGFAMLVALLLNHLLENVRQLRLKPVVSTS